jgi:hypothetical protein
VGGNMKISLENIEEVIAKLEPLYFMDENGESNMMYRSKNRIEAIPIKSDEFEWVVQREVNNEYGKILGAQILKAFKFKCIMSAKDIFPFDFRY